MKKIVYVFLLLVFVASILPLAGCGSSVSPTRDDGSPTLARIPQKGFIGGVAAGVGYYFGVNPIVPRLLFVLTGVGDVVYLVLWIFLPAADSVPADFDKRVGY